MCRNTDTEVEKTCIHPGVARPFLPFINTALDEKTEYQNAVG